VLFPKKRPQEGVAEFKDLTGSLSFNLTPEAAVAFFQEKGLKPTFAWQDMIGEEHSKAFTVAKIIDVDLLKTVRDEVDAAIKDGHTIGAFRQRLEPILQQHGWWGRKTVVDPLTGQAVKAQLGSPARLRTIFRTNMASAYSVGHWQKIQINKAAMPFLQYDAVDDLRTRPEHAALDGLVLPVDHPFWHSHYPPNGWNCRCGVIQMTRRQLIEHTGKDGPDKAPRIKDVNWTNPRTGQTIKVPADLDPGWDINPGQGAITALDKLLSEKVAALPADMKAAALTVEDVIPHITQEDADKITAAAQALRAATPELSPKAAIEQAAEALKQQKAQIALDQIATENPPYLGAALKATKAQASAPTKPADLLEVVQAKAAKTKASADLAHYKQAVLKGKKPPDAAKAAFDALPDEAQTTITEALTGQLKASQALAAQVAKAESTLLDIIENPKGQTLKNKLLVKRLENLPNALKGANGLPSGEEAIKLLGEVTTEAADQQAKASLAATLSGYKKKILAGKLPSPAQKAAFEGLDDAAQAKVIGDIEKKKKLSEVGQAKAAEKAQAPAHAKAAAKPKAAAPEPIPSDPYADIPDDELFEVAIDDMISALEDTSGSALSKAVWKEMDKIGALDATELADAGGDPIDIMKSAYATLAKSKGTIKQAAKAAKIAPEVDEWATALAGDPETDLMSAAAHQVLETAGFDPKDALQIAAAVDEHGAAKLLSDAKDLVAEGKLIPPDVKAAFKPMVDAVSSGTNIEANNALIDIHGGSAATNGLTEAIGAAQAKVPGAGPKAQLQQLLHDVIENGSSTDQVAAWAKELGPDIEAFTDALKITKTAEAAAKESIEAMLAQPNTAAGKAAKAAVKAAGANTPAIAINEIGSDTLMKLVQVEHKSPGALAPGGALDAVLDGAGNKGKIGTFIELHGSDNFFEALDGEISTKGAGAKFAANLVKNKKASLLDEFLGKAPPEPAKPVASAVQTDTLADTLTPPTKLRFEDMTKVGEQGGSNPGGVYQDGTT